jgi:hypothetical protein
MPNSEVSRVELNANGSINLVVDVHGFQAGAPVEISGSAVQENGAVATFYSVQPAPADPSNPSVNVGPVAAVGSHTFDAGIPVTVVARAAEVWISTLGQDASSGALQSRVNPGSPPLQAAWQRTDAEWAVALDSGGNAPAWQSGPV